MSVLSNGLKGFSQYYVDDDKEIKSWIQQIQNENLSLTQQLWRQQSLDERCYAGDANIWGELFPDIPLRQRNKFNFNKSKRTVNMVSGYQRRNRKSLSVIPRENSDDTTSNQISKAVAWSSSYMSHNDVFSDACLGALITGMNLLSYWVDHSVDPYSGDIQVANIGYNGFMIDPYFKKLDLSDCNHIRICKYLSKEQIIALLPEREKDIEMLEKGNYKNNVFNFLPEFYDSAKKNLFSYEEFWYLDSRQATVILDPSNEEALEWDGDDESMRLFLKNFPGLRKKKIYKQTCKLAILVNGTVVYNGANPNKIDKYPFIPVMAYHQPDLPYYESRIQGMMRGIRDSQYLLDRRQNILLDVMESQVNSGLKVMEDSLVDDRDAFKSGQGAVQFIKKNAPLGMESIQKIPSADVSPAFLSVIEMQDKNIMDISGVNEELLGSAEDDKAGILSKLRQGAGLTTLQVLFDHFDTALKNVGELMIDLIQSNFTKAKIRRITEEEPTEEFFNKTFKKYDCVVVEGTDTPTQKMEAFKQKLYLKEIGIPIPTEDLMEDASFQNKGKTIEKIQQAEQQAQQMEQQNQMLEMQKLQMEAAQLDANVKYTNARTAESGTKSLSNIGLSEERRMEAVKDLNQSELDKIKAIKELQGIDLAHIKQAIEIMQQMKADEAEQVKEASPLQEAIDKSAGSLNV
jgi:hypothetical protein